MLRRVYSPECAESNLDRHGVVADFDSMGGKVALEIFVEQPTEVGVMRGHDLRFRTKRADLQHLLLQTDDLRDREVRLVAVFVQPLRALDDQAFEAPAFEKRPGLVAVPSRVRRVENRL